MLFGVTGLVEEPVAVAQLLPMELEAGDGRWRDGTVWQTACANTVPLALPLAAVRAREFKASTSRQRPSPFSPFAVHREAFFRYHYERSQGSCLAQHQGTRARAPPVSLLLPRLTTSLPFFHAPPPTLQKKEPANPFVVGAVLFLLVGGLVVPLLWKFSQPLVRS
jgi:hypothetical protein